MFAHVSVILSTGEGMGISGPRSLPCGDDVGMCGGGYMRGWVCAGGGYVHGMSQDMGP